MKIIKDMMRANEVRKIAENVSKDTISNEATLMMLRVVEQIKIAAESGKFEYIYIVPYFKSSLGVGMLSDAAIEVARILIDYGYSTSIKMYDSDVRDGIILSTPYEGLVNYITIKW